MSSVTAILVAYNSGAVIEASLSRLIDAPEISEIYVVDNCSTDHTVELIQRDFPKVKLIENPSNLGFGVANNMALGKVRTDYALLINPDAVLQEGAMALLLEAAERYPDAAILAPELRDEKGEIHISYKKSVFEREKNNGLAIIPEGDVCADYLSGAAMLCNMAHWKQVGFFDPKIFLYYEDDDICLRMRKAGFGLVLVPEAKCVHLMGSSSGSANPAGEFFRQKHMIWSRLYVQQKYFGKKSAAKLSAKLRAEYAMKAALYTVLFNKKKLARYKGRLAGTREF